MSTISHMYAQVVQTNASGQCVISWDPDPNAFPQFVTATVQDNTGPADFACAVVLSSGNGYATIQVFEFRSVNLLGLALLGRPTPAGAGRNVHILIHKTDF